MMCRLSAILAGGLVQKWIPLPPDPTKTDSSTPKTGGRKSGEQQTPHSLVAHHTLYASCSCCTDIM